MDLFTVETVYKIYDETTGVHWEIGPDIDGLGLIEIREYESDSKSEKSMIFPTCLAATIANYLLKACKNTIEEVRNE